MRLQFQKEPWDLYAAMAYAVVALGLQFGLGSINIVAALPMLLIPGYVILAVLFPRDSGIDWFDRATLSVGLSILLVTLSYVALSLTSWRSGLVSVLLVVLLLTIALSCVAYWRRMREPIEQRLAVSLTLGIPAWKEWSLAEKIMTTGLAACVVIATGALTYFVVTPPPGESFTEFYLLGPSGNASGYPTRLNVSQNGSVVIGVVDHEAATVAYSVRVDLVGVRIVYNTTAGHNETVEVNRTTWDWFNATLADGANWTHPYTFSIAFAGLWKVQFLLFKSGDLSSVYRELHLYVTVK